MPDDRYFEPEIEAMPRQALAALQQERILELVPYVYERSALVRRKWEEARVKPGNLHAIWLSRDGRLRRSGRRLGEKLLTAKFAKKGREGRQGKHCNFRVQLECLSLFSGENNKQHATMAGRN